MSNTMRLRIPQAAIILAPRQVWLATLGAAAVTRHWAESQAGTMFRTLVREGATVESKALRRVNERVETSVRRATQFARTARRGVSRSVASLTEVATTFVRTKVPTLRAHLEVESAPARKAARPAKRKSVKRTSRRATKSVPR